MFQYLVKRYSGKSSVTGPALFQDENDLTSSYKHRRLGYQREAGHLLLVWQSSFNFCPSQLLTGTCSPSQSAVEAAGNLELAVLSRVSKHKGKLTHITPPASSRKHCEVLPGSPVPKLPGFFSQASHLALYQNLVAWRQGSLRVLHRNMSQAPITWPSIHSNNCSVSEWYMLLVKAINQSCCIKMTSLSNILGFGYSSKNIPDQ